MRWYRESVKEGVWICDRGVGVGHCSDHGDATSQRRTRTGVEVLLMSLSRIPAVHVYVYQAGESDDLVRGEGVYHGLQRGRLLFYEGECLKELY